jgi:hypothetical protein
MGPLLALIIFFPFSGHCVAVLVADYRRPIACVGLHLLPLLAGGNLLAGQTDLVFLPEVFSRGLDVAVRSFDAVLHENLLLHFGVFISSVLLFNSSAVLFIAAVPFCPSS